jgi:hypothetical protein
VSEISTINLAENTIQKNFSGVGCVTRVVASEIQPVTVVTATWYILKQLQEFESLK